jgi:flavin reductase (DIM6/NTAB) family NADH-FMN oxidoreductase RutF
LTRKESIMTAVQLDLRKVYGAHPSGVTAVAALADGRPTGIAASSFVPVSLDPPLVSVCVAHTSSTWPALRGLSRIGISVLAADQEWLSRQLGGPASGRFENVAWRSTGEGAVFVEGAVAWFDCTIERQVPAGDHDIVLFAVQALGAVHDAPLVFHGSSYRRLT